MRKGLVALSAVTGPGLLAGLSDDDPAGITTYSILGADYGYELLWVIVVSTAALILFHDVGSRLGIVTGQGLAGLVRDRFGVRVAAAGIAALIVANLGTTCAEFAGIAAAGELGGVPRMVAVPLAAVLVSALVLRGSFHRVEHVLLALCAVFAAYIFAGVLAHPDWGAAARGAVVPSVPFDRDGLLLITAAIGTTLAPWGLAFIQSYAVDKRLTIDDLRLERVDVTVGAVMTGIIGVFVAIACAATLHQTGTSIEDASDAARALEPLAGSLSSALFAAGLVGAALLAASILPLATAYAVGDFLGREARLDDSYAEAPIFYRSYAAIMVVSVVLVLIPGAPLVSILYLTQALNAVLLLPLLWLVFKIARDREVMGEHAYGRTGTLLMLATIVLVGISVGTLGVLVVL